MADNTPKRRSARQPVPNKKYANEDIEILNKVLASDSEDDLALIQQLQEDSDSDDEFPEGQITAEVDDDDDDDDDSSLAADASDGSGIKTPVEEPGNSVIDVGKSHATIAAGGADGSVIVTNPQRKILGRREPGYQQCIFKHEWVRRPDIAGEEGERRGISRITEGYRATEVLLGSKSKSGPVKESVVTTTMYEEETAVTALAWNPNVCCGGWLAVGWGSGLVRIQDVAI
ncbi:hypothetical protein P7C71_g1643, partial [Lecanoromycetidae sp. Uapishka_2]